MKFVGIIVSAFIFLISLSTNAYAIGWLNPDKHQRILEEGYSELDIFFMVFSVIGGTTVSIILFLRERRRKINKNKN